jgi:ABC-type ATPase with predicted acetyltransferase domain
MIVQCEECGRHIEARPRCPECGAQIQMERKAISEEELEEICDDDEQ